MGLETEKPHFCEGQKFHSTSVGSTNTERQKGQQ